MPRRKDGLPKLLLLARIAAGLREGKRFREVAEDVRYSIAHVKRLAGDHKLRQR